MDPDTVRAKAMRFSSKILDAAFQGRAAEMAHGSELVARIAGGAETTEERLADLRDLAESMHATHGKHALGTALTFAEQMRRVHEDLPHVAPGLA